MAPPRASEWTRELFVSDLHAGATSARVLDRPCTFTSADIAESQTLVAQAFKKLQPILTICDTFLLQISPWH